MDQYSKLESGPVAGPSQPSKKQGGSEGSGEHEGSKVFKRKRLAKACDPCHKSKRRCDGTAPCSNCHFASKICTYTDSSGRSVPPPRNSSMTESTPGWKSEQLAAHGTSPGQVAPSVLLQDANDDGSTRRKRIKMDPNHVIIPPGGFPSIPPSISGSSAFNKALGSDPALTRELVNLFFTHRHPQRMIFHKPSFSAALSHNRVPNYLLRAICALAAPLSKQAHFRDAEGSSRAAGNVYADEAVTLMFNKDGQMICERNLETAQALCLLQMHQSYAKPSWTSRFHATALQVLDELGLHKPDNTSAGFLPSIQESIDRECIRRVFWLIHLLDLISSIYFKVRAAPKGEDLRLPVDETNFELATHAALPAEYLNGRPHRHHVISEIGHVIKVLTIYDKVENMLDGAEGRPVGDRSWITESYRELETWEASLPDNLRYSEANLQIQMSMMETSSNTGAWCFLLMHVIHASCSVALDHAKLFDFKGKPPASTLPSWAKLRMEMIATCLGNRAKNSMILGCILWPLIKYYQSNEAHVVTWNQEYHQQWGIWTQDTINMVMRRPQPLPPQPQPPPPQHSLSPPIHTPYGSQRELGSEYHSQGSRLQPYSRETADIPSFGEFSADSSRSRGQLSSDASLPSLKSSGLLDSWSAGDPNMARQLQWMPSSQGRIDMQHSRTQYPIPSEPLRGGSSSLPAGMPWLAKEPMSR